MYLPSAVKSCPLRTSRTLNLSRCRGVGAGQQRRSVARLPLRLTTNKSRVVEYVLYIYIIVTSRMMRLYIKDKYLQSQSQASPTPGVQNSLPRLYETHFAMIARIAPTHVR